MSPSIKSTEDRHYILLFSVGEQGKMQMAVNLKANFATGTNVEVVYAEEDTTLPHVPMKTELSNANCCNEHFLNWRKCINSTKPVSQIHLPHYSLVSKWAVFDMMLLNGTTKLSLLENTSRPQRFNTVSSAPSLTYHSEIKVSFCSRKSLKIL